MKKIKRILSVVLCLVMIVGTMTTGFEGIGSLFATKASAEYSGTLKENADGSFRILQLADIQDNNYLSAKSFATIRLAIRKYNPNLIVLTGDNVLNCAGLDVFKTTVDSLVAEFKDASGNAIPFAVTFGNHDYEANYKDADKTTKISLKEQYEYYLSKGAVRLNQGSLNVSSLGDNSSAKWGTGYIDIYNNGGTAVTRRVILLNTGSYDAASPKYARVGYNVQTLANENYDAVVTAVGSWISGTTAKCVVYQHIAMQEVYLGDLPATSILTAPTVSGFTTHESYGQISNDTILYESGSSGTRKQYVASTSNTTVSGTFNEAPKCSYDSTKTLFKALAKSNVLGVFYGHDHANTISGETKLTYDGTQYTLTQGFGGGLDVHDGGYKNIDPAGSCYVINSAGALTKEVFSYTEMLTEGVTYPSGDSKIKYIKEVALFNGASFKEACDKARTAGYIPVTSAYSEGYNSADLNSNDRNTRYFNANITRYECIAYKQTTNPAEAITDLRIFATTDSTYSASNPTKTYKLYDNTITYNIVGGCTGNVEYGVTSNATSNFLYYTKDSNAGSPITELIVEIQESAFVDAYRMMDHRGIQIGNYVETFDTNGTSSSKKVTIANFNYDATINQVVGDSEYLFLKRYDGCSGYNTKYTYEPTAGVPETIYLGTSTTTFNKYLNNTVSANGVVTLDSSASTTGKVYFYCPDATAVTVTAANGDGSNGATLNSCTIGTMSGSNGLFSANVTAGTISAITSGTSKVIKWQFSYTVPGSPTVKYQIAYSTVSASSPGTSTVDKTELREFISNFNQSTIVSGAFTTYNGDNGFATALANASYVLGNPTATQADVDSAIEKFKSSADDASLLCTPEAESPATEQLIEDCGGYIYGICQPTDSQSDIIYDAQLQWVRIDIPCPFTKSSSGSYTIEGQSYAIRSAYTTAINRCVSYHNKGFKVMAVTPYPKDLIADMNLGFNTNNTDAAFDANLAELYAVTDDVINKIYTDVKADHKVDALQITNEMGIDNFTKPLKNMQQAANYIAIQLQKINDIKTASDNIIIGYNLAKISITSLELVDNLTNGSTNYTAMCDYVAIDLYTGAQGQAIAKDYVRDVKKLYSLTNKPVIITEFGFWSEGGRKTDAEKAAILLDNYGYSSQAAAISAGQTFVDKLPTELKNKLSTYYGDRQSEWASLVFEKYSAHMYGETSSETINDILHTPEGQVEYFKEVMTELKKVKCLAGMIIYSWQDKQKCFECGHSWCPYETKYGITNYDGTLKPVVSALKELITKFKAEDAAAQASTATSNATSKTTVTVSHKNSSTALRQSTADIFKGSTVITSTINIPGYTVTASSEGFSNATTAVTKNFTAYTPVSYTATIKGLDSTTTSSFTIESSFTLSTLTKDGYVFKGWKAVSVDGTSFDTTNFVKNKVYPAGTYKGMYGNVTFEPQWDETPHTVTFNANSGSNLSFSSKIVYNGNPYGDLPTVTAPSGQNFAGWYTATSGGNVVSSSTICNLSINQTLYARYTTGTYRVVYDNLFDADEWLQVNYNGATSGPSHSSSSTVGTYSYDTTTKAITVTAGNSDDYTSFGSSSYCVPITAGKTYVFSATVTTTQSVGVRPLADVLTSNGSHITYTEGSWTVNGTENIKFEYTAPDTAAKFSIRFGNKTNGTSVTYSNIRFIEKDAYCDNMFNASQWKNSNSSILSGGTTTYASYDSSTDTISFTTTSGYSLSNNYAAINGDYFYMAVTPGASYTISAEVTGSNVQMGYRPFENTTTTSTNVLGPSKTDAATNPHYEWTFQVPDGKNYITLVLQNNSTGTASFKNVKVFKTYGLDYYFKYSKIIDTVNNGASYGNLLTPIRQGYIFDGWYSDLALTNKIDGDDYATGNIHLYSKWKPTVEVTYDNLFSISEYASSKSKKINSTTNATVDVNGNSITVPMASGDSYTNSSTGSGYYTIPVNAGSTYCFSLEMSGSRCRAFIFFSSVLGKNVSTVNFATQTSTTSKWITTDYKNPGGKAFYSFKFTVPSDAPSGEKIAIRFDGNPTGTEWYCSDSTYSNIRLVEVSSGADTSMYQYISSSSLVAKNELYGDSLQTPSRPGYRFDGWYTNPSYTGNPVTSVTNAGTSNTVLYSKWTKSYDVMYNSLFDFDQYALDQNKTSDKYTTRLNYETNSYTIKTTAAYSSSELNNVANGPTAYRIKVTPGHVYRFSVDVTADKSNSTGKTYNILVFQWTAANSTSYDNYISAPGTNLTVPPGATRTITIDVTADSTADTMSLRMGLKSTGASIGTISNIRMQDITANPTPSACIKTYYTSTPTIDTLEEKDGYCNEGWYTVNTNGTVSSTTYSGGALTGNLMLSPKYTTPSYTVTYSTTKGTAPSSQSLTYGANPTTGVTNPTATGYRFTGWFTDSNGLTPAPLSIKSNLTLYAGWEPCIYNVGFDNIFFLNAQNMPVEENKQNSVYEKHWVDKAKGTVSITYIKSGSTEERYYSSGIFDLPSAVSNDNTYYIISADYEATNCKARIMAFFYDQNGTACSIANAENAVTEADGNPNSGGMPYFGSGQHYYLIKVPNGCKKIKLRFDCAYVSGVTDVNKKRSVVFSNIRLVEKTTYTHISATSSYTSTANTVIYGTHYNLTPSASNNAYIFEGWYTDSACNTPASSATCTKTGDHTLYSKWRPTTATVTLNKDGSAWTTCDKATVQLYQNGVLKYTLNQQSNKSQYKGEAIKKGTYDIYVENGSYGFMDTETDITINPTTGTGSATVNFYTLTVNAGTGIESTSGSGIYFKGTSASVSATPKGGYGTPTFDPALSNGKYNVTSAKTITASASTIGYKVEYANAKASNGITPTLSSWPSSATSYNVTSATTLPTASANGYTFTGWKVASESAGNWTKGDVIAAGTALTGKYGNVTLSPVWTVNTNTLYKVQHYQLNASGTGYTLFETENCYGTTATTATAVSKEYAGFTYNSSYNGNVKSGTIAADGTLVLKLYYTRNQYTVTLNGNGATTAGTASVTATYGAAMPSVGQKPSRVYTVTFNYDNGNADTFSKATYTFNGFYGATSGGTQYYNSSLASANAWDIADNSTIYAQWTPTSVNFPANPTKAGYTFAGWKVTSGTVSGTLTNNTYATSATSCTPTSNVTLTAQWAEATYTVTLDGNGATTAGTTSVTATYGAAMPSVATAPQKKYTVTFDVNSGTSVTTPQTATYTFNGFFDATSGGTRYYNADRTSAHAWDKASNSTLYAQWTGGSVALPTTTRTGYTFAGWKVTSGSVAETLTNSTYSKYAESCTPTSAVTLTAQWVANKYTVTLNGNGATSNVTTSVVATYGSAMPAITKPTRTHTVTFIYDNGSANTTATATSTFNGYFDATSGGNKYYKNDGASNCSWNKASDTILYAQWTEVSASFPTNPTKDGYTFAGWKITSGTVSSTPSNSTYATTATSCKPTSTNVTLTAQWTKKTATVTFDGNGTSTNIQSNVAATYGEVMPTITKKPTRVHTVTFVYNDNNTANTTANATYTFKGYYDATSGGTQYYNSSLESARTWDKTSNTTLYAQWSAASVSLSIPTRTGYVFNGWKVTSGSVADTLTDSTYSRSATSCIPTSDVTLTAQWISSTCTVTLNGNGATTAGTASVTATSGSAMPAITIPVKKYTVTFVYGNGTADSSTEVQYTFKGYFDAKTDGNKYYTGAGASAKNWDKTSDTTLYAQWTAKSATLTNPTRGGYTFAGWKITSGTASGMELNSTYATSATSCTPTSNVTLTAQWTEASYTVSFNGNGATSDSSSLPGNVSVSYGEDMPTITKKPTREYTVTFNYNGNGTANKSEKVAYKFTGFFNAASGGTKYYNANLSSNRQCDLTNNTTLYAQWTAQSVALTNPTRIGYRFDGWKVTSGTASGMATNSTYATTATSCTPTSNVTLTAQWTAMSAHNASTTTCTNGSIAISATTNIAYGTEVVVTPTADTGYGVKRVYYKIGDGTTEYDATIGKNGFSFLMPDGNVTVNAEFGTISSDISSCTYFCSLVLSDNIDISLNIKSFDFSKNESNLKVYSNGKLITDKLPGTNKFIIASVAPEDMSDSYRVIVTYNDVVVKTFDYSVSKYCTSILKPNSTATDALKKVCKATLYYGECAQKYFKTTDTYVTTGFDVGTFDKHISSAEVGTITATSGSSITGVEASLSTGSTTAINLYLTTDDYYYAEAFVITNSLGTAIDPDSVTAEKTDTGYKLTIANISAYNLSSTYVITTSKDASFKVIYSPYNYLKTVNDDSSQSADLRTLTDAMYIYSNTAIAYKTSLGG